MAIHHHGTPAKYRQGCRCNLCQLVHAMYHKPTGPFTGSVPTGPVREHVNALRAGGWTVQQIADRSGYHAQTITAISTGRKEWTGGLTAEDIMSIPVPVAA